MQHRLTRGLSALSAVGLFAIGLLFALVLVANSQDNAYVGLWLIGAALVLSGIPYLVGAAVPAGQARRRTLIGALTFSALIGILGLVILVLSLVVIPTQDYAYDDRVLRNHVIALLVFAATYVALFRFYLPALRR